MNVDHRGARVRGGEGAGRNVPGRDWQMGRRAGQGEIAGDGAGDDNFLEGQSHGLYDYRTYVLIV
jgi:hypothetical protein